MSDVVMQAGQRALSVSSSLPGSLCKFCNLCIVPVLQYPEPNLRYSSQACIGDSLYTPHTL